MNDIKNKLDIIINKYHTDQYISNILLYSNNNINTNYYMSYLITNLFSNNILNTIVSTNYILKTSKEYIYLFFYKKINNNDINIKDFYICRDVIKNYRIFVIYNIHFINKSVVNSILNNNSNIIICSSNRDTYNYFYNIRIPNKILNNQLTNNKDINIFYNNIDKITTDLYSKITIIFLEFIFKNNIIKDYIYIREYIYKIFKYNYNINLIIRNVCNELIGKNITDDKKNSIIKLSSEYSHKLKMTEKKTIILEDYIFQLSYYLKI